MWYPHSVTVAAAAEPVTLSEAKAHLRVDSTDEDTLIGADIAAARDYIERYTGTFTAAQTVTAKCDSFADFETLPILPLGAVSSVSYVDVDGNSQTLASSVYEVRSEGLAASIVRKAGQYWPEIQTGSRITVTATVGYSAIPAAIKQAMLLLLGDWYRSRENSALGTNQPSEMPHAVTALLSNYRAFGF